jgi:hypothetical protein
VIKCEEDYDFKMAPVFDPPRCDKRIVAKGIEEILEWNTPINTDYITIEDVAKRYIAFAQKCSEK